MLAQIQTILILLIQTVVSYQLLSLSGAFDASSSTSIGQIYLNESIIIQFDFVYSNFTDGYDDYRAIEIRDQDDYFYFLLIFLSKTQWNETGQFVISALTGAYYGNDWDFGQQNINKHFEFTIMITIGVEMKVIVNNELVVDERSDELGISTNYSGIYNVFCGDSVTLFKGATVRNFRI
eukprot:355665_1